MVNAEQGRRTRFCCTRHLISEQTTWENFVHSETWKTAVSKYSFTGWKL